MPETMGPNISTKTKQTKTNHPPKKPNIFPFPIPNNEKEVI
jgi:hypothetical protein